MNKKRFLRGTVATAITAGVIIAVILLNILCTIIINESQRFIDLSEEKLYTISDESKILLDKLKPEENNITIYFLADPDELNNASIKGNTQKNDKSTWGMKYVYEMAKIFANEYDFISIDTLDMTRDAELLNETYASTVANKFTALDVIIDNCADGVTHNYRICKRDSFFTFDTDSSTVFAANGDYRYTSTILSLSGSVPCAYFVTGHGEKTGSDSDPDDFGDAAALTELFAEAGFASKKIDLSKEDFPVDSKESIVNGSSVVVIYGPTSDFETAEDKVNEITKLRQYVDSKNHHLMVFIDPDTDKLNSLEEYLYDVWGMEFNRNTVIADRSDEKVSSALSDDGKAFAATYEVSDSSVGVSLTATLIDNLDSIPAVYFANAGTINMKKSYTESYGYYDGERSSTLMIGSVFNAPDYSAGVYKSGAVDTYSDRMYDFYYDSIYQDKYSEKLAEYTNRRDDVYKAVLESKQEELQNEKYNSLYDAKYSELYNEYIAANPATDEKTQDTVELEAMNYAIGKMNETEGLIEGFENEARTYAETKMANLSEDDKKKLEDKTDSMIVSLAKTFMNSYLEKRTPASLMTMTYESWSNELSNNRIPTYVIGCASTSFASGDILDSSVYGNRDVLYYAMRLMGKEIIPFDIDFIVIADEALNTSDANTTALTVVMTAVPALIVIAIGAVVLIKRRKNR